MTARHWIPAAAALLAAALALAGSLAGSILTLLAAAVLSMLAVAIRPPAGRRRRITSDARNNTDGADAPERKDHVQA